jgi:hypothetical protein
LKQTATDITGLEATIEQVKVNGSGHLVKKSDPVIILKLRLATPTGVIYGLLESQTTGMMKKTV